jgi:hypothetical protein
MKNESLLVVKMSMMKREQQRVMDDLTGSQGADHNTPLIVIVCVLSLKVLHDRGTRGTSI